MDVMGGGGETPLSAVRLCRMDVSPRIALDKTRALEENRNLY